MKKRIIKTISTVLILAFAAQDMVWANPEIFERGAASSAVQIPSMFQYIRSDTYEKMLEAKLEFVLSSISSLKDFDYRLTLPMEEQGIKIDLGFDRPYREGDNTVIPCFLTAPISVSQYEAVIGPDRSLKELRKPKSETKPATLSEPMREKREPGALGAAAADWPGFTPGDKQYTDEPANDPEQKDISTGPVKAVMPPFVKRIFKVLTFTSIAGIAVAILFAGGYLDWYVQIKGSIPPGAIFYWPAAMLDIITGVFICGTADAVGQYINHGKDIRVRQSLIMGLFGILQGVLTHMLLNIPDLLPVIHQGFIQELFRTGVVLPGGFIISLVWARATSFGRRILRVKDYSERKELKKTLDVMLFKFTIAPLVTYMIINKLAQPVRVVTTQIWDYIMTIFVSYLMHRRDSLLARHILKLLHIAPSVEKVEVPEDDLAIMVRKASYIEYYANFVDPQDIRYIAIPILRNIMRDEGPLVRVAAKRMLNNLRGRLKVPRFNMSPRSEAEGKKIEESLKIIRSVNTPVNIAWIIPMYKEERRLNPKSQYNPLGEDALRKKIAQALTLRKTNPLVQMRFYMVDDASPGYYSSANSVNKLWRKIQREYARNGVMFPPEPDMVKVIRLSPEEKKGKKGGAVLLGIQDALKDGWADYIGYTDLDISTDIRQAGLLLDPLLAGKAGTAIGSRWTKGAQQRNVPLSGRVSSKVYNWCVQLLIPPLRGISDTQRGFKLFSREAAGSILPHAKDKSFAFDTELLLLSKLKGFNIAEVPISWSDSAEASTLAMPTESLRMLRSLFVQRRHMFNAGLRKHGASNSGPWLDKPMNRPGQSGAVQIGDLPPSNGSSRNGSPQTRSGDDPGALGQGNAEAPLDEYLRGSLWPSIPGPLGPNIYFDERCINRSFKTLDLYNEFDISKEIERRVGESHGKPVKILLLGVGRGFEAFGMMQKYREKAEITATAKEDLLYRAPEELVERFQYYDISVTAEEAAEYIRALRSRYIKCDLDKGIPLREKYDLVIMGQNVGVYLYKKIFALEECLRVCAEDGVVYFDHDAVYIASGNKNISAGEYLKQLNDPRIMIFDVYGDRGKFINAKGFKSPQFTEIGIRKDGDKTVPFVYTYYKPLRPTESGTGDNAQLLEPPAEQAKLGILSSANWNAAAGLEPSSGQETAGPWPNQPLNGPGQFGAVEIGDLPPPDESPRDGAPQAVSPETANNLTSTIERSWHADALAALMTEPITNSELFSQLCDKGHSVSYAELVEFIRDSKAILSEDDVFKGTYEKWGEVFSIISKEDFEKKGRLLTEDEEIALGKLKYNGNRAAWKALICFNIRLIPHLRKTYIKLNPRMSILRDGNKLDSDVDIICFQALMRAAAKFNWRRDSRFSSYAGPAIYHALGRLWRNFSRRPQINVRSSGEDEEGYDDLLSMLRGKERIFRNGEENLCFSYFIRDILKAPEVNHRVLLNAIRLFKFDNGVKILIEDAIKRYCPGHLEKIIQMFMSYMRADENQIEMGRMLHTTRANVSRMVIRILKKLNKAGFLEELKEICEEAAENIIVEGIAEERPGRFRLDLRKGKKTFTVTYEWREPEAALCKDRAEKLTQKIIEASKQLALEGFRVTKCQIALVCGITDRTLRNYEKRSDAVSAAVRNALKSTARLPKRPVSGAAAPSGESANPTLLFKGKLHAHSSVALLHTAGKMEAEGARFSGEDEYWLKALGTGPEWSKEGVISVYQHVIDKLRELCGGELKGKRLLEIGCGDGRILRYLKEEFGMDVVGIEVSPVAIEMAKRHNGLDGKIFPPEESQKIAKQWADIILSIRFLEQLTAPEHIAKEALRESDRILKSGGLQLHFTSDAPYAKALSDIGYSGVRKEPAPVNGYFVYARKRATDVAAESLPRIAKPGETPPKSPLEPGSDLGKRWLKQSAEDQPKPVNRDGKPKKITPKQIKRGILIRRLIKKIEEHGKKPTFKRITDAIAELAGNSADIEPLTYTQVIRTLRANGIWLGGRLIDDKARTAQIKRITAEFSASHNRDPFMSEVVDLMNAENRFKEVTYDNLMKWFEVRKIPWESLGIGKAKTREAAVWLKRITAAARQLAAKHQSDKVLFSDIRAALNMKPSAFSNCLRRLREKGIYFEDEMRKIGSTIIHLQSTGSPKSLRSKELRLKRAVKPAAQPAKTAAESEQIKPVKAKPVPAMDDKFKSLRIKPLLRIDYLQIYNEFKKLIYKETGKSAKLTDILNYAVKAKDWQFVFTVIQRIENSTMKLNRDDRSCVDDAKDAVIAANLEGKPEDRGPYPDKPSKGAGQFGAVQIGDMRSPDESSRNGAPQAAPAAQPQGEPEAAACYSITDMGEYKQILISASPVEGATLEEQGAELLSNIDRILAENGCGRDSVVKQVVFLKDFSDRKKCEEIMGKHYVRGPPPATSYIHQPPINGKSISIEITAIPKQYIERVNSNLTIVEQGGMRWAHVAGVETDAGIEDTYEQSLNIFLKMQRLLEANGFKFDQVVRTWIYVNNILGDDKNRQRYQLLNDARRLFFETGNGGKPIMFADARPPASTGIGMLNGNIVMECLALDSKGKHPRILPIENPEQTSAFLYSDKVLKAGVSPKKKAPPLFSRGMAVISGGFQTILISGTASVKGEKPVHPGDVEKQTETMIENVGLVLGQVGATIRDIPQLRVYIKNIPDYEKVKNIVEAKFPDVPCVFVHADVCRTEWLVEMEAIAYSAKQSPAPDFSDRYLKLERFLAKHGFAYGITTDGSAHWPTPPEALCAIFDILKERYGDLKGRHFFDFGAGDLRASLAAVYLYGMDAAACEKDKIVRGKALRVLRSAEKEGFAGNDNPDLLPAEDALDENWDRHDFVFFFYTHPSDKKEAEDFRAKLQDKMNNMRTGTVAALLFTGDEMALGFNKFPNLHDELSGPIQISDMHDGLYLQLYQAPSAIAGAAAPQSMRIAKPGETPPKSAFEPGSDLGKRWLKQPPEDKRKPGNQDGEPAKITPKQIKRGILIRKVIKKIEESGKNPTFKRITDVIAELAKNRAGIEPLSKTQVIISLRANGIRLKSRLIDDEARIAQIKRITADFLTRHNRKPLLQEVADLMNAESRFEEVNYDNLMKWFEVRKIPWESLGIGKRERGPDVQLKRIIAAVKELAARNRSDKVLLSDIRAALKMKPSAFSNCLRRLREKGIDFKDEMKRIGINIIYSQSTERQGSFRSKKLRLKRTVKPAAQPAKTAAAPPAKAKPVKAEPAAIKPAETKPVEIKPVETKPGPTMDDKFKTLRIKPLPKIYYLETYDLYRMLIDSPRFIDILNYAVKIHDWHFVFTMIQKIEAGGRELTSDDKACVAKAKEALIAATDGAGQFGVVQTGDIPLSDYDGSSGNDTDPAVSSSDAPSPAESSQASPGKTGDGPVRIKNTRTTHADDKRRVRMSSILRGKGMERVPLFVKDTMSDMPELLYVLVVNFLLLFSDFVEIEVISSAENRHAVVKIICRKDEDSREFEFELDYSAYLNLKKEIERRLGGREEAIIVKHYGIPLYLKLGSEGSINIAGISSLTSALIENLTKRKRVWKRRAVLQKIVTAEKSELRIARPDETPPKGGSRGRGLPGSPNRVSDIFAAEFGDPFAPLAVAQLLGRHPRLDKGFGPAGTYGAYFSDRRGITVSPEFSGSDDIWRLPKSGDSVADIVQEAYKCFGRRQWTIDELRRESRLIKSVPDTVTIDKVARAVSMYLVEPVNIGGNSFRLSAKGLNIAGLLPREKEVSALINRADQYDKLGARVEAKIEREKAARLLAALGRRYYYLENYINSTLCRELYGQINESIKKFRYASKAFLLAGRSYEKMAMYGMAAECYERSAMNRQRTGEQDKIKNPESAIIWALAANSYRKAEMKKEAADCERRVGELRNSTPKAEFAATEPAAVSKLSYGDRKAPDSTKIGPDEARYFVQPAKDTDEAGRKRRRLSRARAIAPAQDPEGKVTDGVNIRVPAVKAPKTPRVKREAPDESPEKEDPYLSPGTLQVNIPPFITGTPARPANLSREIIRNIRSYLDQLDESVASSDLYGSLLDLGILEGVTYERFLAAVRDIGHPKLIQGERPPAANYLDWGSVYRIVPDYEKNHAGIRLTLKQEQELGKEKDKGNAAAWHALYYLNRQLPYAMIRTQLPRIKDTAIDPGDLLSAGISALDRAVTKYDWSRGFKFSTYACDAIDNAYNRYIEQGTRREKKRISNPEDSSAASAIWDRFASLLESSKERPGIVDIGQLSRLLTSLGGLERRVAELRFGFVPPSEEEWRSLHSIFPELARNSDTGWPVGKKSLTLRQTGVIIGLSNEKIRQAEKSALSKLREKVLSKPAAPRKERPAIVKDAKDALKPKPPAEADQSLNYGDRGTGPGENRLGIHHYKPTPEDAQGEWDEIDGFQKIRRRDGKGKERDRQEESAPLNKRALKHKSYNVRPFIAELDREIVPANDVYAPSAELTTFIAGCIDNDLSGRKTLDIGTGTGVLGLIMLKRNAAGVVFADIKPQAIACAKDNVAQLGYDVNNPGLEFICSDLFSGLSARNFDLVVFTPSPIDSWDNSINVSHRYIYREHVELFFKHAGAYLTPSAKVLFRHTVFPDDPRSVNLSSQIERMVNMFAEREGCVLEKKGPHARSVSSVLWRRKGKGAALLIPEETYVYVLTKKISGDTLPTAAGPEIIVKNGNSALLSDRQPPAAPELPAMAEEKADANGVPRSDISQKTQSEIPMEIIGMAMGVSENDQFEGTRLWLLEQLVLAEGGRMSKLEIACLVHEIIEDLKHLVQTGFSENTVNELVKICPNSRKIIERALEMVREDLKINRINRDSALLPKPPAALLRQQTETARGFVGQAPAAETRASEVSLSDTSPETETSASTVGTLNLLGYCGLFCGACYHCRAVFINGQHIMQEAALKGKDLSTFTCLGCRSNKLYMHPGCAECAIRACAQSKGLLHCALCEEYPCERLKEFQQDPDHIHHFDIFSNLQALKEEGPGAWLEKQERLWTCQTCQTPFSWYDQLCPNCHSPVNSYSDETRDLMGKKLERPKTNIRKSEESNLVEPIDFLRNIADAKEVSRNMIEGILSALFLNKKIVLAFNKNLRGYQGYRVSNIVEALDYWKKEMVKHHPDMEKLIANFIAMEYSTAEDLKRSLAVECPEVDVKDITGNNLIFTFAPMPQNGADDTANIGSAIRTTYLSEVGRFEEDDCLPIPQGVVIAVAREFSHWDADHIKEKLCELGIEYKMIGIGDIKENADGALIIYALPGIKRYSLSGMPDQNKRWLEFLREA